MKKGLKITLIVFASIILLGLIIAFAGWRYFNSSLLDFEKGYTESLDFKEITKDGYTFWDRNNNGELDIYEDERNSVEDRVSDLVTRMTIEEKIHLLKGSGLASAMGLTESGEGIPGAVGTIVPTPRLGIPTVYLSDGPAGLRIQPTREGESKTYYCTAFPIGTMLAATWNQELVESVGEAMGKEAFEYGLDVILGPGANIHRHPFCGRNFEYYSEDPVLTGKIGAAMVNGIEANGVGACVKHYVANNQETDRFVNDVIVSERAMREIYLKGFEIIVKDAQPWSIMSSYNKVNGIHTSESRYLLTDILRGDWGFEGLVMTDWFGGVNVANQIQAGNDLLEPGTKKQWKALIKAQEDGELSLESIDIAVGRILKLVLQSQKMKGYAFSNDPDLKAHAKITRQSASEGIVLLKNEGALPIPSTEEVALLGVTSYEFIAGGTGSGDVNEAYTISLEEGLKNAGFTLDQAAKDAFDIHKANNPEAFVKPEGMQAMLNPYKPPEMIWSETEMQQIAETADIGIVTIGRNSGEGGDRVEKDDFLLSDIEQDLIRVTCETFHQEGKKVVVVLNVGGVIETASWKAQPDAILLAWQGGQEGGNSVADILSGKVNPSGRLPMTFPVDLADHASHANFPLEGEQMNITNMLSGVLFGNKEIPEAEKVRNKDYTYYEEGIYLGYRHFDKANLGVSYPFGYGLSYAKFEFRDMEVSSENDYLTLRVTIQNIGTLAGKEVAQVYISKQNSAIDRPLQELKAFAKTQLLEPNTSQVLSIRFPSSELQYWNEELGNWAFEPGTYHIQVGASSRDIRQSLTVELPFKQLEAPAQAPDNG
ncbi:MAG: glycoside hydrolase family 3 C-terminal domain-containing protein [Bacteroidota bacterium]